MKRPDTRFDRNVIIAEGDAQVLIDCLSQCLVERDLTQVRRSNIERLLRDISKCASVQLVYTVPFDF